MIPTLIFGAILGACLTVWFLIKDGPMDMTTLISGVLTVMLVIVIHSIAPPRTPTPPNTLENAIVTTSKFHKYICVDGTTYVTSTYGLAPLILIDTGLVPCEVSSE